MVSPCVGSQGWRAGLRQRPRSFEPFLPDNVTPIHQRNPEMIPWLVSVFDTSDPLQ
jgi:hypothetical protein